MRKVLLRIYYKLSVGHRRRLKKYSQLIGERLKGFKKLTFCLKFSVLKPFFRKRKVRNINFFEQRVYSQNGEDGILNIIFYKIGFTNKFFVEFGVEDGAQCNTRYLVEKQKGNYLYMDCGENLPPPIKKEKITAENINSLFKKYNVPKEFDALSVDIDLNDYWVWKALRDYSPRVVVIEYNASIPLNESVAVKYNADGQWDGTNYFGASLSALVKLGESKGYTLLACDKRGVNAFFVRNDLIGGNFEIRNIKEIYKPPRYGRIANGRYVGYPPSPKTMISV